MGPEHGAFPVTAIALGASCTVAGAFVAASRAGQRFVIHGLAVGVITFAISFARFLSVQLGDETPTHSITWEVSAWLAAIAAGWLGGYAAGYRERQAG